MDERYNPSAIEPQLQARWQAAQSFAVREDPAREKFYCLCMFPYPSGRLHMGHVRNYTIGDVIARYQRMQGKNVLQPMGWDAFGLPAENAAIENNIPPARWTRANIDYMRGQLQRLGFGYDWARELATCDPTYYRWEQWFFTQLYARGLVYRKTAVVNWDPIDQTVLANEQVIEGRGWRSGALVERREIPQWFVRITAYADELLTDLDRLEGWPEPVKTMQRNWIGRSEGLSIRFELESGGDALEVFTTRPDTLFGVTYMAVAPEHPIAKQMAEGNDEIAAFLAACAQMSTAESVFEKLEKLGLPLGVNVLHPLTGQLLPVWVANFVLMSYGTGAVMSVPGHDQRDYEFAKLYGLPIKQVIFPAADADPGIANVALTEKGLLGNSAEFDGLDFKQAFDAIAEKLASTGRAERRVQYRLRDWLVSRQRYWGCPIPVVYTDTDTLVPESPERLPVVLPEDVAWQGVASPLLGMPEFTTTTLPGTTTPARRETDTFDTFFESSWYFARFCCPDSDSAMVDYRAKYWMPVDIYIGGIEHAVLHLLYARFFHKLMRDAGLAHGDEPFTRLLTQGMVCKETYFRDTENGKRTYFSPTAVEVATDDKGRAISAQLTADGKAVQIGPVEKMSKSKNNGIDPQTLIDRYGADTVRLYTMFAAPPEQTLEWSDSAVEGSYRFLRGLWRLTFEHTRKAAIGAAAANGLSPELKAVRRRIHETIAKVTDDISRRYKFNTAIAAVMELVNALQRLNGHEVETHRVRQEGLEACVLLLAPIVPHCADSLWEALGNTANSLLDTPWPKVDTTALIRDEIELVVQVSGKKRGIVVVAADAAAAVAESAALADLNVQRHLQGHTVRKVVVIPGRLVNIVID
ncbi:MAG: leucine--tRNA ligase [Gammaproteobacteria bacterium]|nr:leucine--tRNA ligase [Gammaproteobacteria bacterium]